MAELAMLADIQRTVYSEEVTRQLHVMMQTKESWPAVVNTCVGLCWQPVCFVAKCVLHSILSYNNK